MGVAQGRLGVGFFWSIILMVSMPFTLTGLGVVYFRRLVRGARADRAVTVPAPTNPVQTLDSVAGA